MKTVRLALNAMATRFELVLLGDDERRLRSAGEEALREVAEVDRRFSFYSTTSELSYVNRHAAIKPVVLAPDFFDLLSTIQQLWKETDKAFDPSVGPLMRAWGFADGKNRLPEHDELERSRAISGFGHVLLDPEASSVQFEKPGCELDLGGIGKGYALDLASGVLREHNIGNALLHGGTSTVAAMGISYDGNPWRIGIQDGETSFGHVDLIDSSLSVSATSGKRFFHDDQEYGHIIDPRSGTPARGAAVAACICQSATTADAMSTAALVLASEAYSLSYSADHIAVFEKSHPDSVLYSTGFELSSFRNLN